jgi:hypothetical protein
MRKNSLLIAVAAAALAVGSGTAFAQSAPQGGQRDNPAASHANPASKNAPAERIQGGADHKAAPANRMGEANKPKAEPAQKMGQDNKAPSNRSTTGQAPSERNSAGQANERRDDKMGQEKHEKNELNKNRNTSGQAPSQQPGAKTDRLDSNADKANQPNRATGANENRGGATVNERSETRSGAAGGATVNLSSEQKTKIHTIIVGERSAPRVAHVDFDLNVGTVVPRGRVTFVPLPSTIVEIEPRWRGFEYFLVGDEIVVVDPATLRIVAVVPA